jgi:CrcB protein
MTEEGDAETTTESEAGHLLKRLEPLVLIAVGGFVGAMLRHLLAVSLPAGTLPWGTLAANVLGSFALSVLLYEQHLADLLTPQTRLIVGTGFLSSFTTYSTFALETASLSPESALLNVAANYVLGFTAIGLGQIVARWLA